MAGVGELGRPADMVRETPQPLFQRLDLDEILAAEQNLVEEGPESDAVHGVKGGKRKEERNERRN